MYGSSFWIDTGMPRLFSSRPSEAAVIPFPSELTTPPVKKMNLAMGNAALRRLVQARLRRAGQALAPTAASPSSGTEGRRLCRNDRDHEAIQPGVVRHRLDARARKRRAHELFERAGVAGRRFEDRDAARRDQRR